jgi:alpha-2-macroglobulin
LGFCGGWSRERPVDELRWYVADDRKMYRPGETVHLKGWLRRIGAGEGGDLGAVGDT